MRAQSIMATENSYRLAMIFNVSTSKHLLLIRIEAFANGDVWNRRPNYDVIKSTLARNQSIAQFVLQMIAEAAPLKTLDPRTACPRVSKLAEWVELIVSNDRPNHREQRLLLPHIPLARTWQPSFSLCLFCTQRTMAERFTVHKVRSYLILSKLVPKQGNSDEKLFLRHIYFFLLSFGEWIYYYANDASEYFHSSYFYFLLI